MRAACLWAAEYEERFEVYVKKHPRVPTIRGLHDLYKAEQKGGTDPSVYIYRMLGPVSRELLEPKICKIGCADNGAAARIAAQSRKAGIGYLPKIEMELKCTDPSRLEKMLHKKFKNRRVKVPGREWFEVTMEEVRQAIGEMERDGVFWQNGDWITFGRRPKTISKYDSWSNEKKAANLIYKEVLPDVALMNDDIFCINRLSERTGLETHQVKDGLEWLVKNKYINKREDGVLRPSDRFLRNRNQRDNKSAN